MTTPPHDLLTWLLAALAGAALGTFFFGSLWWTVQKTLASSHSALWHLGSLVLRMAVTLGGFYAVGAGQWQRLLACLMGFVIARAIVVRVSARLAPAQPMPAHQPPNPPPNTQGHA